jgi:hypothetical protein
VRKVIARWTERIGLRWAITKAAWGRPYPPPTVKEAHEWWVKTPRNSFYDAHTPGVKNLTARIPNPKEA